MSITKNTQRSDFEDLSDFLSKVSTVANIGASGILVLDAYANKKDLRLPIVAFLLTLIF